MIYKCDYVATSWVKNKDVVVMLICGILNMCNLYVTTFERYKKTAIELLMEHVINGACY